MGRTRREITGKAGQRRKLVRQRKEVSAQDAKRDPVFSCTLHCFVDMMDHLFFGLMTLLLNAPSRSSCTVTMTHILQTCGSPYPGPQSFAPRLSYTSLCNEQTRTALAMLTSLRHITDGVYKENIDLPGDAYNPRALSTFGEETQPA